MKPLRFLVLSLAVVSASLVPQMPSQASELVKLGRLLVTGKRAPATPVPAAVSPAVTSVSAAAQDEAKSTAPLARVDGDRAATGSKTVESVQEAREGQAAAGVDRPVAEPKGLERGGVSGGAGVSSDSDRGAWFNVSLRGLLRGI
jgi:hypothetical protein